MAHPVFRMRFDCENDAFTENGLTAETANILREVASRIERGEYTGLYQNVKDSNGNTVGTFRLASEKA